jgi:predicted ATP-grasp superfamily ATP-dependent carboligase
LHVALWDQHCPVPLRGHRYFQRRVYGLPCAAVYVAARRRARLIGVTEQLLGGDWTGGGPFQYAGSIGPLSLGAESYSLFNRLGDAVALFGLVGLFGIDCVLDGAYPWPIEVNPRYPASAEVLERASGASMVGLHVAACRQGVLPKAKPGRWPGLTGKAIVYARGDRVVDAALFDRLWALRGDPDRPDIADIPRAGTALRAGWPALTMLADGADQVAVRDALTSRVAMVRELLDA